MSVHQTNAQNAKREEYGEAIVVVGAVLCSSSKSGRVRSKQTLFGEESGRAFTRKALPAQLQREERANTCRKVREEKLR